MDDLWVTASGRLIDPCEAESDLRFAEARVREVIAILAEPDGASWSKAAEALESLEAAGRILNETRSHLLTERITGVDPPPEDFWGR